MGNEYEVITIDELSRVSDTRGLETYYRIRARTKGGTVFHVDVNEDMANPDKAAPILLKAAQRLDAIKEL